MSKKIEYKVSGTLKTKPEGLPDGLTITEVKTNLREKIPGAYGKALRVEESITYPDGVFVGTDGETGVHLTKENTEILRGHLNTILGTSTLRVVHDGADSSTSRYRWYEIAPDKFTYAYTTEGLPTEADSSMRSYDWLVASYGTPRSVTFR